MPESILTILKLLFIALLYLFFFRVLRAVWVETGPQRQAPPPARPGTRPSTGRPAAAPSGRAAPPGSLRVVAPSARKGATFPLADELTVGRAAGCQVALPDDTTVSQLHARIFRSEGRLFVEDLGSTNGTFVNRKKVEGRVGLRRGDRLQVGETVLEVSK